MKDKKETSSYSDHLQRFSNIEFSLNVLYENHKNKKKIIKLLEYWLFALKETFFLYGESGLDSYLRSQGSSPIRHAFSYEFRSNIYLDSKEGSILFARLFLFFFDRLILPGAPLKNIKQKLLSRLSLRIFSNLPQSHDSHQQNSLVKILLLYFEDIEPFTYQKIKDALPAVFYSRPIKLKSKGEINLDGTAHSFMDFSGFENILLLDLKLKVNSFQHGGGYDCFNFDYYSFFEKEMSDEFYGWGLSPKNIRQHRYRKIKENTPYKERKLIWVERPNYPKLMFPMNPGQYLQHTNQVIVKNIYNSIAATKIKYFNATYPGNLRSADYDKYRGLILGDGKLGSESYFNRHDLILFDSSAASLIHFCIENSITFFLVVDKESQDYFTPMKDKWFSLLRSHDMAFFHDETQELSNAIEKAYNSDITIPEEILDFNNVTFNLS